jgi:hypothetical protein
MRIAVVTGNPKPAWRSPNRKSRGARPEHHVMIAASSKLFSGSCASFVAGVTRVKEYALAGPERSRPGGAGRT